MKIIENPKQDDWLELLKRPTQTVDDIESIVNDIFNDVMIQGDEAIASYTSKFDNVAIESIEVPFDDIMAAESKLSAELIEAIKLAKSNIYKFHAAQKTDKLSVETAEGVICWQEKRAIDKVGLYIPGGTAPLFSTILMLAVPAKIVGCSELILCTPPNKEGQVADEILYTAHLCGIRKIFRVGGIQAIAGLTFGTESIPQVYKIFGPGNQFVTVAKQLATKYGVAIDMPAGPSELMVVADESANASYVASDLLSQAEHGVDSQVILITNSKVLLGEVNQEISNQITELPRKAIAEKAIANSKLIYLDDMHSMLSIINVYAPEHLILAVKDKDFFTYNIRNAGSVFIGNYTPESAGDYASGTNHTLPTNGFAKAYSGVNLDSFQKSITFQEISKEGIQNIGNAIELMAEAEGLQAHKNAVTLRLKDLES
ncbi:histidinol dehydrogenase [Winogradskyella sp. PG-2]|uniref:histidinol dehydrogenase n=1 Tax=Winogradskyella sp. PG-2 TaxID=754409 RepID=UPI0004586559|nr:histidinol dehydrogenase [Winogradskyella sp. PG-2]BAO77425.1 histidinol dehydrogenase [Winogradskyella sp. PG-2]